MRAAVAAVPLALPPAPPATVPGRALPAAPPLGPAGRSLQLPHTPGRAPPETRKCSASWISWFLFLNDDCTSHTNIKTSTARKPQCMTHSLSQQNCPTAINLRPPTAQSCCMHASLHRLNVLHCGGHFSKFTDQSEFANDPPLLCAQSALQQLSPSCAATATPASSESSAAP